MVDLKRFFSSKSPDDDLKSVDPLKRHIREILIKNPRYKSMIDLIDTIQNGKGLNNEQAQILFKHVQIYADAAILQSILIGTLMDGSAPDILQAACEVATGRHEKAA